MKVEFLKFYETSRDDAREHLIGTLHIRLPELSLNIKGIHVFKKKNHWFVGLPSKRGFDKSFQKEVNYSVVLFDSKEKNDELITAIKVEGRKFVEEYLKANPQTLETLQVKSQDKKDTLKEESSTINKINAAATTQTLSIIDKKSISSIVNKKWIDVPRKQAAQINKKHQASFKKLGIR